RVLRRPRGRVTRPVPAAIYGTMRDNAISRGGANLGCFWFAFSSAQIKEPYARELSPLAGHVDSNGNDIDSESGSEWAVQCRSSRPAGGPVMGPGGRPAVRGSAVRSPDLAACILCHRLATGRAPPVRVQHRTRG